MLDIKTKVKRLMTLVPKLQEIDKVSEEHINSVKIDTGEKVVIDYKNWKKIQYEQPVYSVPIEYCKYRVDNGRIMTDVLSYKSSKSITDINDPEIQKVIAKFLSEADREKNIELRSNLKKDGQLEPAIITADGLLINGNRRKLALETLYKQSPSEDFKYLKVVILPGTDKPDRPTLSDIALLENRLQFQRMGKSEYTAMNKALKLYFNEKQGNPLEEMLKDDPVYSEKSEKEFKKSVTLFRKENFKPIELMIEYLNMHNMKNDFKSLEKKWSSFQELVTKVLSKLDNERTFAEYDIKEGDIGLIKAAAYNIIKLRDHSEVEPRNHLLIRNIFKWISADKKELLKIGRIEDIRDDTLTPSQRIDRWNDENNDKILNSIKKLNGLAERQKDQEGPLARLEEAYQKVTHNDLSFDQLSFMQKNDIPNALKLANTIQTRVKKLVQAFYELEKGDDYSFKKLLEKFKKED